MSNDNNKNRSFELILALSLLFVCICFLCCLCVIGAGLSAFNGYVDNQPLATEIVDDFGVNMNLIPEGVFTMGQHGFFSEEAPMHDVYLAAYYMDVYEVTNDKYKKCVDDGACEIPVVLRSRTRPSYFDNPEFSNYPVIYVTWQQAVNYCEWRGARLPTEVEWEKAARGMEDTRDYPWGDGLDCSKVNYDKCGDDTSEVGSFISGVSPYGLYDMSGNVWEWVADWRSEDYYAISPQLNPLGPAAGDYKVLRGGSWNGYDGYLRVSYRGRDNPVNATNDYGFRCVRSVP